MPSPSWTTSSSVPAHADALVVVLAEDQRLAVLEVEDVVVLGLLVGHVGEGPVVEDVAVLVDLDEGRALVRGRPLQGRLAGGAGRRRRERATKVASAPRARESGLNGRSTEPVGRRLGLLAQLRGRRVLALGQAVDAVVEQQDLEPDVAAQHVDQVVAADRQRVAVAGGDPHLEVGPRQLEAGGHRRRAAVDGVEAVGVHVVREAAGAADAGDDHELLARDARARGRPVCTAERIA